MMNSKPLVSVIIPTFNRLEVLKRAILSVENQTYSNIELIVVDDGSSDGTGDFLNKNSIKFFTLDKNRGVSFARNFGVARSKGEYIAFLDSDDEWLEEKIAKQINFLNKNNFRWCHGEEIWVRNGIRVNPMKKHKKGGGDQFLPSLNLCLISPSTVMMEKSLFDEFGGFKEDFIVCEDYDLWLRILNLYKIGFIEDHLIKKYGGHEDQLSRKYFAMDEYRITTLIYLLENGNLTKDRRVEVGKVLKLKSEILYKGFIKHKNAPKALYYEKLLKNKNYFS